MTEPNLSALTKMEQLVFGADAKKDAAGNIIEQGHGNLHDRVKKVEAAIKAAVPNIPVDTVVAIAQQSVLNVPSVGVPVQLVPVVAPNASVPPTTPAAVTVAPTPVTPAPVAVAPTPSLGSGAVAPSTETSAPPVVVAPAPVVATTAPSQTPVATTTSEPVTVAAVQAAVPAAPATVIAAIVAAHPKATHESIVAKLKAIFNSAEAAAEEIL